MRNAFFILALLLCQTSCKKKQLDFKYTGEYYLDYSTHVAQALQGIQQGNNHLWQRAGWWNSANILEAMLDYSKNSGMDYSSVCTRIYNENINRGRAGFKSKSYDDNAWWALAWIKAYDLYGDSRYLQTAGDIFTDMVQGGWDNNCGGGMAWQSDVRYKNAITNELFITLAAKLAAHQSQPWRKAYYLDWSLRGWQWLENSGMINPKSMINDGLGNNCTNNGQTEWTYNQGVILGGLKELYLLTNDSKFIDTARLLSTASMRRLSNQQGILTEPCYPNCSGGDNMQFKGIYIRYLSELNTVLKDPLIKQYVVTNADKALSSARNDGFLFDVDWQGPFSNWTGAATGTGLDLLNAATLQSRIL